LEIIPNFDYHLPQERIAVRPLEDRAASRMLVLHRRERRWEDRTFRDLPEYIGPGDCLVLNDSKVIPSRLYGQRAGVHALPVGKNNPKRWANLSGRMEALLVRPVGGDPHVWEALVHPGRKMRTGERVTFAEGFEAEIVGRGEYGQRTLRFDYGGDVFAKLDEVGHVPLPPYLHRPDEPADRVRYQTVFAREPGSSAAPTAGLHFTPETLEKCRAAGAELAYVTLHVGLGTFQPLHEEMLRTGRLHPEFYHITEEAAAKMRAARRVVAVGTTSVRTIESAMLRGGLAETGAETELFIQPGFEFRATGAMLTNFHLPKSSLLMLVAAFAGREFVLEAYRHAVEAEYRFYSYGDCMLIV
jgi:S-adenosylmethionine:tRNA ribosyltransferase-isomerase